MRQKARPSPVDLATADAHLPGWDHADAFEIAVSGAQPDDALSAARCVLDLSGPGRALLRTRDVLVRVAGLEPASTGAPDLFPVLHSPELVVLGMDDRHLDFRVLISLAPARVRCTTVVRRHGLLGRACFAVVEPFHVRIVPRLLAHADAGGWQAPDVAVPAQRTPVRDGG